MSFTACNSSKNAGANPFFAEWTTPYGVPPFDSIRTEHYMPAFERAMSLHEAEIDAIVTNKETPTFENTLLAYD
ncbi:MAG: peptidase M3, partial [Alistipes sp.]